MPPDIRVGTQGWNYPAWAGPFYPVGTRPDDFLRTYARAFQTVEVDSTFYAVPSEKTVKGWAAKVPEGFRFALKLPQEITHVRRLVDARDVLDSFCGAAQLLGPKLGPVLMQFGPDFGPEQRPALERFLPSLPPDVRFAIEFRRPGWLIRPILELLREHRVALALVEGRWLPRKKMLRLAEVPTTDFGYVRFMGPDRAIEDYSRVQIDRSRELDEWIPALERIAQRVQTLYGYVNNHFEGHSPATASRLRGRLGMVPVDLSSLRDQAELF
jgi:uncharacterized protein YecE (DUF72 family)